MEIWINRQQQTYGPYTEACVAQWLQTGQLGPTDLAWCEGQQWQPVAALLSRLGRKPVPISPVPPPPPVTTTRLYAQPESQPYPIQRDPATDTIKRIASYERLSGIFWIVLGAIQCLLVVSIIAGIWNIFAGITRVQAGKPIENRDPSIPAMFEPITQLVIIGLINLFFGGVVGILFVALDFYVRSLVLSNRHLFESQAPDLPAEQPAAAAAPAKAVVPADV